MIRFPLLLYGGVRGLILKHKKVTDGKVAYSGKVFSVCPHTHKKSVNSLFSQYFFTF